MTSYPRSTFICRSRCELSESVNDDSTPLPRACSPRYPLVDTPVGRAREGSSMPFELEIVPRYWEADQQNVVFNMWYLAYMTQASESFFEHIGHPIPKLFEQGMGLQLV